MGKRFGKPLTPGQAANVESSLVGIAKGAIAAYNAGGYKCSCPHMTEAKTDAGEVKYVAGLSREKDRALHVKHREQFGTPIRIEDKVYDFGNGQSITVKVGYYKCVECGGEVMYPVEMDTKVNGYDDFSKMVSGAVDVLKMALSIEWFLRARMDISDLRTMDGIPVPTGDVLLQLAEHDGGMVVSKMMLMNQLELMKETVQLINSAVTGRVEANNDSIQFKGGVPLEKQNGDSVTNIGNYVARGRQGVRGVDFIGDMRRTDVTPAVNGRYQVPGSQGQNQQQPVTNGGVTIRE